MGRQTRLPSAWQAPVAAETNPATQPAHNPIPSIPALRQTKLWRTQESHQDDTAKSPYGDWLTPKDAAHTRFWYHNVNGISAKNDLAEAYQAALVAANQDVDILAMSETNLDWNAHIKGAFCQRLKQVWPVVAIATTSSTEATRSAYLPGGAALVIPNGLSGRVCQRHEDDMGRFSSMVLQGRGGRKIAIICGYRVCVSTVRGDNEKTAFSQQWRILRRQKATATVDPRRQFLQDMLQHITQYNTQDIPTILLWDANEAVTTKDMQKFMRDCKLEEAYEYRFPEDDKPATHREGSLKIDHIMMTPTLLQYITNLGIDTFGSGLPSDHRPFYMDFRLGEYLQGNAAHIEPPRARSVHTKDPRVVQEYCDHLQCYLEQHNYSERLQYIHEMNSDDPRLPHALEKADKDMTQGRAHAAKRLGKRYTTGWSAPLHTSYRLMQYWKARRAAHLNPHRDYSRALQAYETELHLLARETLTESNIRNKIRASAKAYQLAISNADTIRDTFLERKAEDTRQHATLPKRRSSNDSAPWNPSSNDSDAYDLHTNPQKKEDSSSSSSPKREH